MNGYDLSRMWFDFCFDNPEKISPNHSALYFFAIEHCNRLGWKDKFGFPTEMAKDAIGIKSYNTYIKTLNDLVDWGFIKMVQRSKNQYSANIIALSKNNKAPNKALDKAIKKHIVKQGESTSESICSIDKPITIEPINNTKVLFSSNEQKEKTEDDLMYEKFNAWLKANAPTVLKMKEPLKLEQLLKLKKNFDRDFIFSQFIKMHNYKPLLSKNQSAYYTFINWANRETK